MISANESHLPSSAALITPAPSIFALFWKAWDITLDPADSKYQLKYPLHQLESSFTQTGTFSNVSSTNPARHRQYKASFLLSQNGPIAKFDHRALFVSRDSVVSYEYLWSSTQRYEGRDFGRVVAQCALQEQNIG